MQNAIDIRAHQNLLESTLLANQERFSPESFATICSVVAFDDTESANDCFTLQLPVFLHANFERVQSWLEGERF